MTNKDTTTDGNESTTDELLNEASQPTQAKKKTRTVNPVKRAKPKRKKSMGESLTSPRRIKAVEEKQANALEYRKMGYSYAQIAEALGYKTAQGAYCAIQSALTRIIREPAEEVLTIELERLDAMFAKPYQNAINGDLMAIGACLNIMNRKAKLLGLDAPAKQEITGKGGAPLAAPTVSKEDVEAAVARALDKY